MPKLRNSRTIRGARTNLSFPNEIWANFYSKLQDNQIYDKNEMNKYLLGEFTRLSSNEEAKKRRELRKMKTPSQNTIKNSEDEIEKNSINIMQNLIDELNRMEYSIREEQQRQLSDEIDHLNVKTIRSSILDHLREYQKEGIKFMWNAFIKNTGCILAHYMGTGKTLQVIALLDTLFENKKVNKVIICMPKTSVLSWIDNYSKWLPKADKVFNLINTNEITDSNDDSSDPETENEEKENENEQNDINIKILKWNQKGGILLINYQKLVSRMKISEFGLKNPDLIILDEGHYIKNCLTKTFTTLNEINTKRRIILTGTPIINSLMEYKTLIDFVKPDLFGNNRLFEVINSRILENMHSKISIKNDETKIWNLTKHFVHRLDDSILNKEMNLNFKKIGKSLDVSIYEFGIRLTDTQKEMMILYVEKYCKNGFEFIFDSKKPIIDDDEEKIISTKFFNDIHIFHLISTHPFAIMFKKYPRSISYMNNFLNTSFMNDTHKTKENASKTIRLFGEFVNECIEKSLINLEQMTDIRQSNKFVILNRLLSESFNANEKMVIFSINIGTLDLLEGYFKRGVFDVQQNKKWYHQVEYYRIDGQITDINLRKQYVDEFVNEENKIAKVILISRVGGESIDLTGANHCVIWESDWNNSFTKQIIHRIYRYGQKKNIYVYKFFSEGVENLKNKKQLMKQSLSDRILDKKDVSYYYIRTRYRTYYDSQIYHNPKNVGFDKNLVFYLKMEKIYQPNLIYKNDENFGQIAYENENNEVIKETYREGNLEQDGIPLIFKKVSSKKAEINH